MLTYTNMLTIYSHNKILKNSYKHRLTYMDTFTHSLSHMSLLTNSLIHGHTCICLHGHSHVFTYAHALACSQTKILTYSVTHRYTLTLSCCLHSHSPVSAFTRLFTYKHTQSLTHMNMLTQSPTGEHPQIRACVYIHSLLTSNKVTLAQRQTHAYSQTCADAHQQSHVWTWSHVQSYSICKYTYMLSPQSACSTYEHAPTFPTEIIIPHITHSRIYLHTNSLT